MQRREFGVAHLGKRRFSLAGMRRGLWAVRLCTTLIERWSPFFGQVVKLGSPDEKDGPDDGKAEAVWS